MKQEPEMKRVIVCVNHRANPSQPSCGGRGGGEPLAERLEQEIAARGLQVSVERFYCLGHCDDGPVAKLAPAGHFIHALTPDRIDAALEEIEAFARQSD